MNMSGETAGIFSSTVLPRFPVPSRASSLNVIKDDEIEGNVQLTQGYRQQWKDKD